MSIRRALVDGAAFVPTSAEGKLRWRKTVRNKQDQYARDLVDLPKLISIWVK